jgi:hypothetical protein
MISTSELCSLLVSRRDSSGCGFASLPAGKPETAHIDVERREQKAKKTYARDVGKSRKKKSSES